MVKVEGIDLDIDLDIDTEIADIDDSVLNIVKKMVKFAGKLDKNLYPYQLEFLSRIFYSVISGDGDEITALMARQMGKSTTVATAVVTLLILLPPLSSINKKLSKFRRGINIGIFAPSSGQVNTMATRVKEILSNAHTDKILADPDIKGFQQKSKAMVKIYGGATGKNTSVYDWLSTAEFFSADKRSKLESKSFHFIVEDETQEMDDIQIIKSISPMGAAYNATTVQIGTPSYNTNEFYENIQRNKSKDMRKKSIYTRNHFEYDYQIGLLYNPNYAAYIEKTIDKYGEDSDYFKLSFKLEWLLEQGMAMTQSQLNNYLYDEKLELELVPKEGDYYVGGLDIGGIDDPTNLCILKAEHDERLLKNNYTVSNWLDLIEKDTKKQIKIIKSWIVSYNIKTLVIDSTGKGDPIADFIEEELMGTNCAIIRVVFSLKTKHNMATLFYKLMREYSIKVPYGPKSKNVTTSKKFNEQWLTAVKTYKGNYLQIEHPKNLKNANDEYIDSLLLALHGGEMSYMKKVRRDDINMIKNNGTFDKYHRLSRRMLNRKIKLNSAFK